MKKKIFIGIIIALILVLIVVLAFLMSQKEEEVYVSSYANVASEKIIETPAIKIPSNIIDNAIVEEKSTPTIKETEPEVKQEETKEELHDEVQEQVKEQTYKPIYEELQEQEIVQTQEIAKPAYVEEKPVSAEVPKEEKLQVTPTPTPTPVPIKEEKKEEITETTQEEIKGTITVEVTNDKKVDEVVESYTRNDEMIAQMKKVIKENESEYMKQYGYEIVVDSSIKELSNPFTYTANRVKSAIAYKFGTIRIYAENYYKDGQLITIDCYII